MLALVRLGGTPSWGRMRYLSTRGSLDWLTPLDRWDRLVRPPLWYPMGCVPRKQLSKELVPFPLPN